MRKYYSSLVFILLIILTNILVSFTDFSLDLTADGKHSISEETIKTLEKVNDIVFIKVYLEGVFPAEFKHLHSEVLNLLSSFKTIADDNLEFEFINPNESRNEKEKVDLYKQLVKQGLAPTDIEIKKAGSSINQIIFPGAIIYYKDKEIAVNFLKNSVTKNAGENINASVENLEFEFISAIYHISKTKTHRIAFLEGNGELTASEVYDITESVIQNNDKLSYHYTIDRFNIKEFEIDSNTLQADIAS